MSQISKDDSVQGHWHGLLGGQKMFVMKPVVALGGRESLKIPTRIGKSICSPAIGTAFQKPTFSGRSLVVALSVHNESKGEAASISTVQKQEVGGMPGKGTAMEYIDTFRKHCDDQESPPVPSTFSDALLVFLSHPTPILIIFGLISLGSFRSHNDLGIEDIFGEKVMSTTSEPN